MSNSNSLPLSSAYQVADAQGKKPVNPVREQQVLTFAPDGAPVVTVVDANSVARERRQRRELLRTDARRQAEYLATRGKTPIEALHDLVGLGWRRGVRELVRELNISPKEAAAIYERWATTLLPYTAARWDVMEFGQGLGQGLGASSAAAHFLAARAMSDLLARERDSPAVSLPGTSPVAHTVDGAVTEVIGSVGEGEPSRDLIGLPPKAAD